MPKDSKTDSAPLNYKTLAQQALDYLGAAILAGELRTGDRLIESDLSVRLGISRAPIREALAALERQGLAYSIVRHGTFVRSWTKQDLWEVAVLRSHLEALAAELAATALTDDDVAFLSSVVRQMEEAERNSDVPRLIELDSDFHERVLERSGHQRLRRSLADLALQIRITRIVTRPTDHVNYPDQHRMYLDALRTRDARLAHDTAYAHVMSTTRLALEAFQDDAPISLKRP